MLEKPELTTDILTYCINQLLKSKKKITTEQSSVVKTTCLQKFKQSLPKGYVYDYPLSVFLRVTSQCNLRCRHCFFSGTPDTYIGNNEFSKEELFSLLDFLADDLNILSVLFTGGEPFVRNDFPEIVKYAKKKYLPLIIQTNGTLINEDTVKNLASILFPKTDLIHISLDGTDAESNDYIRGKGTFDKAVNTIRLFRKYGISVQVNLTLTTVSAPKMADIFSLCDNLDVHSISINSFQVTHKDHSYLKLKPDENLYYNYLILKEHEKYPDIKARIKTLEIYDCLSIPDAKNILDKSLPNTPENFNPCLICHNHDRFCISADGNVFFCAMDESEEAIIGNLRKQSFYEIWNNRFSSLYFHKRDMSTTKCKNCKYIFLCNTGCMASAYKKYKDINMAPAECTYFEKYIKDATK